MRRFLAHQVVVDDHDIKPDTCGVIERLVCHGPAIDRDHQIRALTLKRIEGGVGGTIAFRHPVRHIDVQFVAHVTEPAHQLRRARGAIDIIIGEDADLRLALQRIQHGTDRLIHVHE